MPIVDRDEEVGKHERKDRHELHDNVESGTGGILERVADGIPSNRRGMHLKGREVPMIIRGLRGCLTPSVGAIEGSALEEDTVPFPAIDLLFSTADTAAAWGWPGLLLGSDSLMNVTKKDEKMKTMDYFYLKKE